MALCTILILYVHVLRHFSFLYTHQIQEQIHSKLATDSIHQNISKNKNMSLSLPNVFIFWMLNRNSAIHHGFITH
ncbi:hypothetical protein ACJX0J_009536, partial [Zea mays]